MNHVQCLEHVSSRSASFCSYVANDIIMLVKVFCKQPEKLKHNYVWPLKFVSRTLRSVALVSEQPLHENYATLYFHTNTVISHVLSYMSRP